MKPNTLRLLSVVTLALLWEIAGRTGNTRLLPPLSIVVVAWFELLVSGQLFRALSITFKPWRSVTFYPCFSVCRWVY